MEAPATERRQRCRCGQPIGADRLDAFGCRVPAPYAVQCACSRLQQLLDS